MGKNQALVRRRWPHAAGRAAPEAAKQPSNVTGTRGRVATEEIARDGLDGSTRLRDVKRERPSKTRARIREGCAGGAIRRSAWSEDTEREAFVSEASQPAREFKSWSSQGGAAS